MKRTVLSVVAGFLAGLFCHYVFPTPLVLAQSSVMPHGPTNQRFVLVDEGRNSVGTLSFDGSGNPVIFLTGQAAKALGGRVFRDLCEVRAWSVITIPPAAPNLPFWR
jgi:hypothetical protein